MLKDRGGGKIYCYTGSSVSEDITNVGILEGDEMIVQSSYKGEDGQCSLDIYGFICQSTGFSSPAQAFNTCFKK